MGMRLLPRLRKYREIILKCIQMTFALWAGFFVWYAITDSDIFWHLSAGRELFSHKKFLYSDPFSFTLPGVRWIDVHWFFQVCMYLCQRIGGYFLLIFVKSILIAAAVYLSAGVFRRTSGTVLLSGFIAVIIYFQRYLIPLRPTFFTLFFIAVFIRQLEYFCKSGKMRHLVPLLIIQMFWVNSQGLFMLGIGIATIYGIGETANAFLNDRFPTRFLYKPPLNHRQRNTLLVLPVVLVVVSLINPYGWDVLTFALRLFFRINPSDTNIYAHTIIENMPLLSMVGTRFTPYVIVVISITVAVIITTLYSSGIRISHLLCAATGLFLAVMAQRNGILYTFFALPALLWNSSRISLPIPMKCKKAVISVITIALITLLLPITVKHIKMLQMWPHALSPFSHPVHSADILQSTRCQGNIFNADRYGGYLLWKTYPNHTVSHDTRLTLRPDSFYLEYLSMVQQPKQFYPWAKKWDISTVCLPIAPIDRYIPLAVELYNNPKWHLVFTDGAEVFFERSLPENKTAIDLASKSAIRETIALLHKQFQHTPVLYEEASGYLAGFCLKTGATCSARKIMEPFNSPSSRIIKALLSEQSGNISKARVQLEKLVSDHHAFTEGRLQLALFYLRHNNNAEGVRQLSNVLKKDPFHRRARNVLYNLRKKQKEQP